MKKLVITLILVCMSSSICDAKEMFSIHKENWSLLIDTGLVKTFGWIVVIIFLIMFLKYIISVEKYDMVKKYEVLNNSPMEILMKRCALGEISIGEFDVIRKELGRLYHDTSVENDVISSSNGIDTIAEKCH